MWSLLERVDGFIRSIAIWPSTWHWGYPATTSSTVSSRTSNSNNGMSDQDTIDKYKAALEKIATYDRESIWMDSRDDAADNMLSIARVALGWEEE